MGGKQTILVPEKVISLRPSLTYLDIGGSANICPPEHISRSGLSYSGKQVHGWHAASLRAGLFMAREIQMLATTICGKVIMIFDRV